MTHQNQKTKEGNNIKTLKIKWQRLMTEQGTCPRCGSTEQELEKAISILKKSFAPLDIKIDFEKEEMSQQDFEEEPLQSNRIWIKGRALEDWIEGEVNQSPCCEVCGSSECRTVEFKGKTYEVIPAELIIKVGLLAASNLIGTETNESDCENKAEEIPTTNCCSK